MSYQDREKCQQGALPAPLELTFSCVFWCQPKRGYVSSETGGRDAHIWGLNRLHFGSVVMAMCHLEAISISGVSWAHCDAVWVRFQFVISLAASPIWRLCKIPYYLTWDCFCYSWRKCKWQFSAPPHPHCAGVAISDSLQKCKHAMQIHSTSFSAG